MSDSKFLIERYPASNMATLRDAKDKVNIKIDRDGCVEIKVSDTIDTVFQYINVEDLKKLISEWEKAKEEENDGKRE